MALINLDDYDGPLTPPARRCTCCGLPPHEPDCMIRTGIDPDRDEDQDDVAIRDWEASHGAPPEED